MGASAREVFTSTSLAQCIADEFGDGATLIDLASLSAVNRACRAIVWPHRFVDASLGANVYATAPSQSSAFWRASMCGLFRKAAFFLRRVQRGDDNNNSGSSVELHTLSDDFLTSAEANSLLADTADYELRPASDSWCREDEALYRAIVAFRVSANTVLMAVHPPFFQHIRTRRLALLLVSVFERFCNAHPRLRAISAHALAACVAFAPYEMRCFMRVQAALRELLADDEDLVGEMAAAGIEASLRYGLKLEQRDDINGSWMQEMACFTNFLSNHAHRVSLQGKLRIFGAFGCIVDSVAQSGFAIGDDDLHQYLRHAIPLEQLTRSLVEKARVAADEQTYSRGLVLLAKLDVLRSDLMASIDPDEVLFMHDPVRRVTFVMQVSVYARLVLLHDYRLDLQLFPLFVA